MQTRPLSIITTPLSSSIATTATRAIPTRKKSVSSGSVTVVPPTTVDLIPKSRITSTSKLPAPVRFPLVVLLNLSLSALLYSLSSEITAGDLSSVSRSLNEWWQVAGLIGCKVVELGIGWWGEYDSYDLASLTILTHLPPLYLLSSFYAIRPTTVIVSLCIDATSTALPFRLLRPLTPAHTSDTAPRGTLANRAILNDFPTQALTSLLATLIYAVTIVFSLRTWLPTPLAVGFYGLRDLTPAYNAQLPQIAIAFLPLGWAAKTFLFVPATGAKPDAREVLAKTFEPSEASLGETVEWNLWGWSRRERTLIGRTTVLVALGFGNTLLQILATVEGADWDGALAWAGVWAIAAMGTGFAYGWVSNAEEAKN